MAQTGRPQDPYGNYNFLVEIDGIVRAAFHDCSGFSSTIDVIEHREGGLPFMMKVPGITKYANITLKWGTTDDAELYEWHQKWITGEETNRRNGSIILMDRQGNEKVRWNFYNAWPVKWDGPDFNAEGNDVAIETLELAYERFELAK